MKYLLENAEIGRSHIYQRAIFCSFLSPSCSSASKLFLSDGLFCGHGKKAIMNELNYLILVLETKGISLLFGI